MYTWEFFLSYFRKYYVFPISYFTFHQEITVIINHWAILLQKRDTIIETLHKYIQK